MTLEEHRAALDDLFRREQEDQISELLARADEAGAAGHLRSQQNCLEQAAGMRARMEEFLARR
jgi:hypothetical protein